MTNWTRYVAVVALVILSASCGFGGYDPHPFEASGVLATDTGPCIAVATDTGTWHVHRWPNGLHVADDGATIVDAAGRAVLRARCAGDAATRLQGEVADTIE